MTFDFAYIIRHNLLLGDAVLSFTSLSDVLAVGHASVTFRKSLQGRCRKIGLCVLPAGRKKMHPSSIVDAYYDTEHDDICWSRPESGPPCSFLAQAWNVGDLKAKVAIERKLWIECCAALTSGSLDKLYAQIQSALRGILWMVRGFHVERILGLKVPSGGGRLAAAAVKSLPRPLTLGQGTYEDRDHASDWMGTALTWIPGISRNNDDPHADGLVAERALAWAEEASGFDFERMDDYPDLEGIVRSLVELDGFYHHAISVKQLSWFTSAARQALSRFGCVWLRNARDMPVWGRLHETPCFCRVSDVSIRLWDFFCGSSAWPVGPRCRGASACQAESAKLVAQFLATAFPSAARWHLFFNFTSQDIPEPSPGVTSMMRALVSELRGLRCPDRLDISVSILWLWEYDFDSLDNVERLCLPGRREPLASMYREHDLTPVCVAQP